MYWVMSQKNLLLAHILREICWWYMISGGKFYPRLRRPLRRIWLFAWFYLAKIHVNCLNKILQKISQFSHWKKDKSSVCPGFCFDNFLNSRPLNFNAIKNFLITPKWAYSNGSEVNLVTLSIHSLLLIFLLVER